MAGPSSVARATSAGLAVAVRVTPKSSRDAIDGLETRSGQCALKVRVRAVPEDGKANAAVAELIATFLDLPKRSATVTSGLAVRDKVVTLTGDAATLQTRLNSKLEGLTQ